MDAGTSGSASVESVLGTGGETNGSLETATPHTLSAESAEQTPSGVRKHFVLDTNVLLHNPNSIFKFAEHEVVIPLTVIEELDTFKKNNDETGRNARQTIRALDRLREQGALFSGVRWNEQGGSIRIDRSDTFKSPSFTLDLAINDNRILSIAAALHASGKRTIFISKDIAARVKCDALGIPAEDFEADRVSADYLHSGYLTVRVPGDLIDELYDERQLLVTRFEAFEGTTPDGLHRLKVEPTANQFLLLIDELDESHTGLGRMLADTGHVIPVTGPRKPIYGIMARNVQQTMAMELLLDDEVKIVTLTGPAGTGKTLIALASGLHKTLREERFDKMLTARPIMPLGRDIGYLPGDKDEKLSMWMQPIFDNISYLLSTRGAHVSEVESRTTEQRLDQLMASGKIILEPLTYIRGRSIPHQFMIVDEAQNLSPHEVKTIVSRVGEGTKIVLCGDVCQIDNPYLDGLSNGLSHCIERMKGQRVAGHVSLSKTERSNLASLAAEVL